MRRWLLLKSIIMITVVTFTVNLIYFIGNQIPVIQDIEKSVLEVDLSDYYLSNNRRLNSFKTDTNITIINIKYLERDSIGLLLSKIAMHKPKVTGIDLFFTNLKNPHADSLLVQGLQGQSNLVLTASFDFLNYDEQEKCFPLRSSHEAFTSNAKIGNGWVESQGFKETDRAYENIMDIEQQRVIRYFEPQMSGACDTISHMVVEIVKSYDKIAYNQLEKRESKAEIINYSGSVLTKRYKLVNYEDIFNNTFDTYDINNRIVLIGFLGDDTNSFANNESRLITPLNRRLIRRTETDMYHVEAIANIISMILNSDYINELNLISSWSTNYSIIFIVLIIMNSLWYKYEGKSFPLRIFSYSIIGTLIFISLISISQLNLKLDFRLAIFYMLLIPEIFKFYKTKIETLPERLKKD